MIGGLRLLGADPEADAPQMALCSSSRSAAGGFVRQALGALTLLSPAARGLRAR